MWTIDIGLFGSSQWLRTAGRYASVDDAILTLSRFPNKDCYGRHVLYRARPCDELDYQYDADRQRLRRAG